MLDKIKQKIEEKKNDKKIIKDYLNIFKKLEKPKELYKDSNDFKKIIED